MAQDAVDLAVPFGHHEARIHVRPDDDGGWAVSTEVDGREIASDYCAQWRHVERFRARMEQWLKVAAATETRTSVT